MTKYLCVRQKRDANGVLREDGEPFWVFVTASTPRYAKRGHSFVTVYRQEGDGPKTCLFPAQEVAGTGSVAARAFLASLGWVVRCPVPRSRAPHNPHQSLRADQTQAVDEIFQTAEKGPKPKDLP